ncbi:hypothetical protein [Clostridium sp.]|uniref:hypothetical protein n=1 Tax=Clostridium sp. TaxID=1506 RepID=UPI003463B1F1
MKFTKILIIFISAFLLMVVGCSSGIENKGNIIGVEKRVGEEDKYEHYNDITDREEVKKVKDILDNINWKDGAVSMVCPPHYKFYFEDANGKTSEIVYELWISPDKGKVELVIDSETKFVKVSERMSVELFKLITGNELDSN